jgi:hypothetical protein
MDAKIYTASQFWGLEREGEREVRKSKRKPRRVTTFNNDQGPK